MASGEMRKIMDSIEILNEDGMSEAAQKVADACESVWQSIAYDIMDEEVSSEEMVEYSTDADRLASSGYEEEQKLFRLMVSQTDYPTAKKIVAKFLPYDYWEAGGSQAL